MLSITNAFLTLKIPRMSIDAFFIYLSIQYQFGTFESQGNYGNMKIDLMAMIHKILEVRQLNSLRI